MTKAIVNLIEELNNCYEESDYINDYEALGLDLYNGAKYIQVDKDYELIESYKRLVDTEKVLTLPYYDEWSDEIIYIDLIVKHVNVLDDYVEIVFLIK